MDKKDITIVIPTSVIASHPSTEIIEETIASARHHLPESPILIMIDGVRLEQHNLETQYLQYIHNLIGKALVKERNIMLAPFGQFTHQAGMLRKCLEVIHTKLLLFMEHDTPLVKDEMIPWEICISAIADGTVNLIRFLHEAEIHPEHQHLMRGQMIYKGEPFTMTTQFSARPHLTTKRFYEELLAHFSPEAKCFVEDKAHSICQTESWLDWKMVVYTPPGNQKRSYHTDGRAGAAKFDETQVF